MAASKKPGETDYSDLAEPRPDPRPAQELASTAKPDDALVLMLIGHGTYDGVEYKFNIPGPILRRGNWRRRWTGFRPRASAWWS